MITSMGGVKIKGDICVDECSVECKDVLILGGGRTWNEEMDEWMLKSIEEGLKIGSIVGGICGGSDGVGKMG
ncbi:DJ-1/PfpI family protein [Bacillus pumilus]|uniref:DJ-1/PfpI family protein n=1 Tax=Bacillus pumilus TaxID=1408 RepID=UPI0011A6E2D6|nr:DJ-1/PfpI family protein [Bacillus pumilus]